MYKMGEQVNRSWGYYEVLEETNTYKIKRVCVNPSQSLSFQLHHHRSEHWVVVHGTAEVLVNGETKMLVPGESTFVGICKKHQLRNPGIIELEVIEIQLGEYLGEDDIIRFNEECPVIEDSLEMTE
jgi:mannose-1-phosphate guanylyltransferase / mannose-6-phosphate isomerase